MNQFVLHTSMYRNIREESLTHITRDLLYLGKLSAIEVYFFNFKDLVIDNFISYGQTPL